MPDRSASEIVHICFHGIGMPGPGLSTEDEGYFIAKDLFLVVLDEVREAPGVELSFDDGYTSDVEIALPAIVERGLRASFFPLAGQLGRRGYVSADGVRELVSADMTIGSHGMRHRSWRGMGPQVRQEELVKARDMLASAAGIDVDTAACPFGAYDRGVLSALRKHGYTRVFTSDRRRGSPDAWLQPRYSIQRDDTLPTIRAGILAPPRPAQRVRSTVAARLKAWR
jgi:peptidoglycan/xylan/chitin deacetylase (PgdA/CDA1 family)